MLGSIREKAQGWVLWLFAILLSITFALWGVNYYLNDGSGDQTAAKVNGEKIRQKAIKQRYELLKQSSPIYKAANEQQVRQLKQRALNSLIVETVLAQSAHRIGFRIPAEMLSQLLMHLPGLQENGEFSQTKLYRLLAQNNETLEGFTERLRQDLLLSQFRSGINRSEFAMGYENNRAIHLANEKRDIAYLSVPISKLAHTKAPSNVALQQYYQQHQNQFTVPAEARIAYVMLKLSDIAKKITVSIEDQKNYYRENSASFTDGKGKVKSFQQVHKQIQNELTQERARAKFAELREQMADIAYTQPTNLDAVTEKMGLKVHSTAWFAQNAIGTGILANPQVITIAFSADVSAGNNSDVITPTDGVALILRQQGYRPATHKPFKAVKKQIIQALQQEKVLEQANQAGQAIIEQLKAGKLTTAKLASKYGAHWQAVKQLTRRSNAIPIPAVTAAFSDNQFAGTPVDGKHYAFVAVKHITPGKVSTLKPKEKQMISQQMQATAGQLDYQFYLQALLSRAKIKRY